MRKNLRTGLFIGILVLFGIGIISMLMQDAGQLIQNILGVIFITAIMSGIFYLFLRKKRSTEDKKYAKALRKAKKAAQAKRTTSRQYKMEKNAQTAHKKQNVLSLKKSRKSNHLYVIEGKKSKKKA